MSAETLLVRTRSGNTYHRRGCPRVPDPLPWFWAEGKTRAEVVASHLNGLKSCRVCKPLDALPAPSGEAAEPTPTEGAT